MSQGSNRSNVRLHLAFLAALALAACSSTPDEPSASPTAAGSYKVGKPYKVAGRWYYPKVDPSYDRIGTASWYGADFHGLKTANGEVFDMTRVSAAHPTLPLPSLVKVTNLENGRSIVLRVNDRGPFVDDRLIDLSQAAARERGYERNGLAKVRVQFVQIDDGGSPAVPAAPVRTPPRPPVLAAPPAMIAAAGIPVTAGPARVQVAASEVEVTELASPDLPPARPASARTMPARTTPVGTPPAVAAASVAAAPVAAALPSCAAGAWVVQVGAFADAASVRAVSSQVASLDRVRVEPAFANGVAVARVRLGPLADRSRAGVLLSQVRGLGHDRAYVACSTTASGLGVS